MLSTRQHCSNPIPVEADVLKHLVDELLSAFGCDPRVRPKRSDVLQELGGATHVCEVHGCCCLRCRQELPFDLLALTAILTLGQIPPHEQSPQAFTGPFETETLGVLVRWVPLRC